MLQTYYPEMGEKKPAAQIEAALGHYGKHYYLWTPLALKGRGIVYLETDTEHNHPTPGHYRIGWHRYKVTIRAYERLCHDFSVTAAILL